jgi:hypothetical protein
VAGAGMNQYIITEEERKKMLKLWSVIQQHIDWQHNACHTLDLTVQEAYNLMENIRSHPYQSERDKVLDEFMNKIVSSRFMLDDELVVRITDVRIIREELRQQAGVP